MPFSFLTTFFNLFEKRFEKIDDSNSKGGLKKEKLYKNDTKIM